MTNTYSTTNLTTVNSTSYSDIVGLHFGITRTLGEKNADYIKRLMNYAKKPKDHSIQGLINNISTNLGLQDFDGISIESNSSTPIYITSLSSSLLISNNSSITKINLCYLDPDNYILWYKLSDVVNSINNISGITANLLSNDISSLQICKQKNIFLVINEVVDSQKYIIKNNNIIPDSILLSNNISYTLNNNVITFSTNIPSNLTITYFYYINPYKIICNPTSVKGLMDKDFISNITDKNGNLGYQVKETLFNIMSKDRSYWSK